MHFVSRRQVSVSPALLTERVMVKLDLSNLAPEVVIPASSTAASLLVLLLLGLLLVRLAVRAAGSGKVGTAGI